MTKLFWKFFFILWLAQLITVVGVGVAMSFKHHGDRPEPEFSAGPTQPAPNFTDPDPRPPHEYRRPHRHPPILWLPIVSGSLVSLLFAALLAWYFAKPIRSLRTAFESVANGHLDTRIGKSMERRNEELANLGSGFDRMATRLESLLDAQRNLLHDVSHELRSPLARMQAAAELMRQQPDRAGELVERIERDTLRMNQLVSELLTLARLDSAMTGTLEEEVDIREILADVAENAQFEADAKNCAIDLEANDAVEK